MRIALILLLLISSCNSGDVLTTKPQKTKRVKSERDLAIEQYEKQEHRFRIEGCKLYYNDKQVILDPDSFSGMFGHNYELYYNGRAFYRDYPIYIIGLAEENKILDVERMGIKITDSFRYDFYMSEPSTPELISNFDTCYHKVPELEGYVMIDGFLVDKNTKIEDVNASRDDYGLRKFSPFMGSESLQTITYGSGNCTPGAWNYRPSYYTIINIIYNMSTIYKDLDYYSTTVQDIQYNYSNDTSFDEK